MIPKETNQKFSYESHVDPGKTTGEKSIHQKNTVFSQKVSRDKNCKERLKELKVWPVE